MAKGIVTEEELARGMKSIGGFSALSTSARRDSPFRDSRAEDHRSEVKAAPRFEPKSELLPPAVEPIREREVHVPPAVEVSPVKRVPGSVRARPKVSQRKAEIFSESVTLKISPEMRDDVGALARELQRFKESKEERITPNTVIRAAIWLLVENFQLRSGERPNNEEELRELLKARCTWK
jgi:hypothetical protein